MNKLAWFLGGSLLTAVCAYAMDDTSTPPRTNFNTLFFVGGGPLSLKGPTDRFVMAIPRDGDPSEFDNFLVVKKASDLACPAGKHAAIDIFHEGKKIVISCFPGDEVP